ncbi:MAG: DUF192 domain-containing protein [Acidimicrobiia bacterium]
MGAKRLLTTAAAAVMLAAAGCGGDDDGSRGAGPEPATTAVGPAPGGGPRQPVDGFGTVAYRVSTTPAAARCALLADSALARARGLMNRTDLAGFDGMLFVFQSDTTGGFWMKDTPLPLSIAWFDSAGRFVSSADMEPCLNRGSDCPSYSARGPYRYALEVPQGGLGELGIGPGAVLTLGEPCT